jgi:hypothetical protein
MLHGRCLRCLGSREAFLEQAGRANLHAMREAIKKVAIRWQS